MRIEDVIREYEETIKSNNESAKRLGKEGLFEMVISCHKDNEMIHGFIAKLKAIQQYDAQNRGPG